MKVIYLIQTHKNPKQIYRLVNTIKKSSPESIVLVSHDFTNCNLDPKPLESIPGVYVLKLNGKGGRGDFSMLQGYLDAVEWIFDRNIEFDWLANISGQDYPTQPLLEIEKELAETKYDGFLHYFEAFSEQAEAEWGIQESRDRYLYQYWRSGVYLRADSISTKILNRLRLAFNAIQPWIRICFAYDGIMVGIKARSTPFNENFVCYGGAYFHTISRRCVEFLYNYYKQNPDVVAYYQKTCVPVESFVQTVLVNNGAFNISKDCKRYFDFSICKDGSPRLLTSEDYPRLVKGGFHFARKFEPEQDSKIIDLLDTTILPEVKDLAPKSH